MKKLNGYRPTHRNKWRFIQEGLLNIQELALLEFYADIFDFDSRHDEVGLFEVDFHKISKIFNCSVNTIRNWHNKLLKVGFIQRTDNKNLYSLSCYLRYVTPGYWKGEAAKYVEIENNQPVEVILQSFGINLQSSKRKFQPFVKKETNSASNSNSIALGSYKDESRDYQDNQLKELRSIKTDEEYKLVKARVEKLGKTIGDNWFSDNPRIKKLVQEHQHLANKMLEYEIEHDLIPI